jgi:hypothetical protein
MAAAPRAAEWGRGEEAARPAEVPLIPSGSVASRVLLVDDEMAVRAVPAADLADCGFERRRARLPAVPAILVTDDASAASVSETLLDSATRFEPLRLIQRSVGLDDLAEQATPLPLLRFR